MYGDVVPVNQSVVGEWFAAMCGKSFPDALRFRFEHQKRGAAGKTSRGFPLAAHMCLSL